MNYKGKKDQVFLCIECSLEFAFKGYSYNHKFCSISCFQKNASSKKDALFEERYKQWLGSTLDPKIGRSIIRQFVIKRDGDKCRSCGITEWNGSPISLWCDHIDGDASNNHPDNFQMICPNCDSQQTTFGAKNTGKGRKARGLPQYG